MPASPNRLQRESSPYLLQHAHNPVDWRPWGPDAFEEARRTGKPIFLSVGYATCYWCHVMERQCFEDEAIAAQMNERFVNVKVDREERPDVDDLYMVAVQAITGRGGWPMSVFLTPPTDADAGLKPFFAGTYFPPNRSHPGLPSFPEILDNVADAWRDRRDEVADQAERVADAIRQALGGDAASAEVGLDLVQDAAHRLLSGFDQDHGGFGGAPKFPQPDGLRFLTDVARRTGRDDIWQVVAQTLQAMADGGIYDQIGGGFHRYATDAAWAVPHFEKMLYDNAQLAALYGDAAVSHPHAEDPTLYARIARETCDYVLREMRDPSGAFWSAQDAEVDGREGGSYLWSPQQVHDTLADHPDAELVRVMYGLDHPPDFRDPHHPDDPPAYILRLPRPLHELAGDRDVPLAKLLELKAAVDADMRQRRDARPQPRTDDKVLACWNGMMIAALARVGQALNQPRYVDAAAEAARAILDRLDDGHGGLLRRFRGDDAGVPGFLDDYAEVAAGLIQLHRATGEIDWRERAVRLIMAARDRFDASETYGGGYFDTLADQPDLFVRTRKTFDGATPSGASQMIHNLLDLAQVTGETHWLERAQLDLRSYARALRSQPSGMLHMVHALLRLSELAPERVASESTETRSGGRRQVVSAMVEPQQVQWPDNLAEDVELVVRLSIDSAYHLNGPPAGDADPALAPTRIELDGAPDDAVDMVVTYPQPVTRSFPFAEGPIPVYEGDLAIPVRLRRRASDADLSQARLMLAFQPCTDQTCIEPRRARLPVTLG